jgi:putative tricarboxylic transport membrane protein
VKFSQGAEIKATPNRRTFNAGLLATAVASLPSTSWAQQLNSLKITAPANPGGGYDQLARAIQDALTTEKLATIGALLKDLGLA